MSENQGSQKVVGVVLESSPDAVSKVFACWQRGEVVVPLRSRDDKHRIDTAKVTEVIETHSGSGWIDIAHTPRTSDDVAQISFTSGTEGEAKGVVLTHRNLSDVVARLNSVMNVTNEIREYVGIPITHSFGFGRVRAVLAAGGRAFIPSRGFNPVEINTMLEAGEINAISAVPSLWRIVLQTRSITKRAGERVRWIEIGSQYMSADEKRSLVALFPNAIIVQHYGLTEASRSTFLEIHRVAGVAGVAGVSGVSGEHLESVGKPVGDVEIALSDDGRVKIRGPHVATKMIRAGELLDPRDGDGWLVTNDLGDIKDGYLTYKGRADDVINCGGLKLAPDTLEAQIVAALSIPASEIAVCRVANALRGDGILVAVTPNVVMGDGALIDAAVEAAQQSGVNARGATHVLRVPTLPRTENGKIKRKELSKLFVPADPAGTAGTSGTVGTAGTAAVGGLRGLRGELASILGVAHAKDQDTFVSLGGDSLRFIQASVVLERHLGYVPTDWEKLPLAELDALPPRAKGFSQLESSVLLRALAITAVVVNHSLILEGKLKIDGAAYLLLLPSGYSFARFQLQRVIETGKAWLALASLPRIIVPAMLILGVQQLRHRDLDVPSLFLFNNWLNQPGAHSYWFIEVFVQLHVALALLLLLRPVRVAFRDHAFAASVVSVIVGAALFYGSPLLYDTEHLHNLLPQFALWFFALGWCALFAKQTWQRVVTSLLLVLLAAAQMPMATMATMAAATTPASKAVWILVGGALLIWLPPLRLPTPVTRAISWLASASLYIYVSHSVVMEPLKAKGGFAAAIVGSLVGGVIFYFCFDKAWQMAMKRIGRRFRP